MREGALDVFRHRADEGVERLCEIDLGPQHDVVRKEPDDVKAIAVGAVRGGHADHDILPAGMARERDAQHRVEDAEQRGLGTAGKRFQGVQQRRGTVRLSVAATAVPATARRGRSTGKALSASIPSR